MQFNRSVLEPLAKSRRGPFATVDCVEYKSNSQAFQTFHRVVQVGQPYTGGDLLRNRRQRGNILIAPL